MVRIKFKIDKNLDKKITEAISSEIDKRVSKGFNRFKPIIHRALEEAVDEIKNDIIPTDEQAYELGIGEEGAGQINREKTEGAWRQLLPGAGYLNFEVKRAVFQRGAGGVISKRIGEILVSVDKEGFLNAPLCVVYKAGSEEPNPIPWMEWYIEGAYLGTYGFAYGFSDSRIDRFSRTGGGIMVWGGVWDFPAVRPQFFEHLDESILDNLEYFIINNIGTIIR